MVYRSEILKKDFKTEKECLLAETEYEKQLAKANEKKEKLAEEKKARAAEIEEAYKAAVDAENKYLALRNKFVEDYGYFHMTYRNKAEKPISSIFDLLSVWG